MATKFIPGDWNAICDVCGFQFKASQLRRRWDGYMVCQSDFERRHPQDFVRARPERPAVPWARPNNDYYISEKVPVGPIIPLAAITTDNGSPLLIDSGNFLLLET